MLNEANMVVIYKYATQKLKVLPPPTEQRANLWCGMKKSVDTDA